MSNVETNTEQLLEEYRELVENASSIILRLDTQGRITFANQFALGFFGYQKQELLGQNVVGTIVPAVDSGGCDTGALLHDVIEHPERFATNQNENMRRDGSRVWVSWKN